MARHQSGIYQFVAETSDLSGVAQTIDFGVRDRIVFLDAFVMPDRD
jgi:hypothetical protein